MSESQAPSGSPVAEADRVPDLDEKQLRRLTELVYRPMRDQVLLEQERRGSGLRRGGR